MGYSKCCRDQSMFKNAPLFNQNIRHWNTLTVVNF